MTGSMAQKQRRYFNSTMHGYPKKEAESKAMASDIKDFPPITAEEMKQLGWTQCDIIIVTGDAYVDHPYFGAAVIARVLEHAGYKVGVICQPDWKKLESFRILGKPRLFFAVTSGNLDSMVANYTPLLKQREEDMYSPNRVPGKRPDRATAVYSNKLREAFKGEQLKIVIGGVEASLRRIAHFDYWDNKIRHSIILDSKADILCYGNSEKTIVNVAKAIEQNSGLENIKGTVLRLSKIKVEEMRKKLKERLVEIPSFEDISKTDDKSKERFAEAFRIFYLNLLPNRIIVQKDGESYVAHYPAETMTEQELDAVFELPFTRDVHPYYKRNNLDVPSLEPVKFSILTHRGCFGGCAFCSLTLHQGKKIISRSRESILKEISNIVKRKDFKGLLDDVGGATANMYGMRCKLSQEGTCKKWCLFPGICENLDFRHDSYLELLRNVRNIRGIKKAFIRSGIRYDLAMKSMPFMEELVRFHISGALKVAPEHVSKKVTDMMRKPDGSQFKRFIRMFAEISKKYSIKNQYVLPYFMAGHPGCDVDDMVMLAEFEKDNNCYYTQSQLFTPTPMTLSSCIYYSGIDPFTRQKVHSARTYKEKKLQKALMAYNEKGMHGFVAAELRKRGKPDTVRKLYGNRNILY